MKKMTFSSDISMPIFVANYADGSYDKNDLRVRFAYIGYCLSCVVSFLTFLMWGVSCIIMLSPHISSSDTLSVVSIIGGYFIYFVVRYYIIDIDDMKVSMKRWMKINFIHFAISLFFAVVNYGIYI